MDLIQIVLLVGVLMLLVVDQSKERVVMPGAKRSQKWLIDTSAIIDGRLLGICESGFAPKDIIIPQFVINELQLLADGRDSFKRQRARYGLDVVKRLQSLKGLNVAITRAGLMSPQAVDAKLVGMAARTGAMLFTTDYNLQKVAAISKVRVINVNELSQKLRMVVLPGEKINVKIIQKGQDKGQGVGYAPDGTMVVVDKASGSIGKNIDTEVVKVLQTESGKMIFGKEASRYRKH